MNKTLLLLMGLVLGAFLQACGPDEVEPAKTVNKDLLTDKNWYLNGADYHYFHSSGKYNSNGTWRWLNESDSMEILDPGSPRSVYYFEYITETEMKCGSKSGGPLVYTSTP
jgi:hypothetical protein